MWYVQDWDDAPEHASDPSTHARQRSPQEEGSNDDEPPAQSQRQCAQRQVASPHEDHSNDLRPSQRQSAHEDHSDNSRQSQRQSAREDHGNDLREWPARLHQKQRRELSEDEDRSTDEDEGQRARNVSSFYNQLSNTLLTWISQRRR